MFVEELALLGLGDAAAEPLGHDDRADEERGVCPVEDIRVECVVAPALIIDAELAALMNAVCASPTTRSLIMPAAPVLLGMCSISTPARRANTSTS